MYEFSNQTQSYTDADKTAFVKAMAGDKLSRIALMLAAFSILLSQTIFLSLVAAGISFMLAVISLREQTRPQGRTLLAMGLAALGVLISLYIIISTITGVLIPYMTDPAFREELNRLYMDTFGIDFEGMMQPLLQQFRN